MTVYRAAATCGEVAGGCAIDGVAGGTDSVDVGGSVVFGDMVVVDHVDVVVGDTAVVDTSGDVDVVAEPVGIGVVVVVVSTVGVVVVVLGGSVVVVGAVVVPVGAVVAGTVVVAGSDVTVIVDGSGGTVVVLGSAGTVTVGVVVTVTVDIEVEVTVPGSGTPAVAWTERLSVAEKLAFIDASVEFPAGASGVMAVVDSVAVAVPVPGSVESALGWAVPGSGAGSGPATPPGKETSLGTETSLGAPDVVLGFVTLVRLRTAGWSEACMVHSPESFARTGGLESARTISVNPIAVVTDAVTTPARDIRRRNRSADGLAACRPPHRRIRGGSASMSGSATRSSLLSPVRIQLLLSPARCADRWEPVATLRMAWPVESATTPPAPPGKKPERRNI